MSGRELTSAEIYDPATEQWSDAGSLAVARRNHRSARLNDGSVLIIGGSNFFGSVYLTSVERFTTNAGQ